VVGGVVRTRPRHACVPAFSGAAPQPEYSSESESDSESQQCFALRFGRYQGWSILVTVVPLCASKQGDVINRFRAGKIEMSENNVSSIALSFGLVCRVAPSTRTIVRSVEGRIPRVDL